MLLNMLVAIFLNFISSKLDEESSDTDLNTNKQLNDIDNAIIEG